MAEKYSIRVPSSVKHYLENTDNVPTIPYNGSLWFYITQKEKDTLQRFLDKVDSIPESEWRTWDNKKKMKYSSMGCYADRIIRNSIIREV